MRAVRDELTRHVQSSSILTSAWTVPVPRECMCDAASPSDV